jgi:hypothetical protein
MTPTSARELTVKLDGLELSEKELSALEKDVNSVVLRHIASTKQHGFVGSVTGQAAINLGKLNKEWLGIWLKKFASKIELQNQRFTQAKTLDAQL